MSAASMISVSAQGKKEPFSGRRRRLASYDHRNAIRLPFLLIELCLKDRNVWKAVKSACCVGDMDER